MKLSVFFIAAIVFLFALSAPAVCQNRVDPGKVILFFNINQAYNEVHTVEDVACQRGETLVVVPEVPSKAVEAKVAEAAKVNFAFQAKDDRECYKTHQEKTQRCLQMAKQLDALHAEYAKLLKKLHVVPTTDDNIYDIMDKIAEDGRIVTTLILSGHSGGGDFSGDGEDDVDRADLFSALGGSAKDNPDFIKNLTHVYLWGCYGWTREEVDAWKIHFPTVRLISGFTKGGPSSLRPVDTELMKAVLLNEENLLAGTDISAFQKLTRKLLDTEPPTSLGIYVRNPRNEEFVSISEDKGIVTTKRYREITACASVQPQIEQARASVQAYMSGAQPVPTDTSGGKLRDLYTFLRINSACVTGDDLTPDRVGNLLFFNSVKRNFAFADSDTIERASREIMRAAVPEAKDRFWAPDENGIPGKSRLEIIEEAKLVQTLIDSYPGKFSADVVKLARDMQTYLVNLDPKCMSFLDWHEFNGVHEPEMKCDFTPKVSR